MRARPLLLLIASALLGVVAIVLLKGMIQQPTVAAMPTIETKKVVVAKETMVFGQTLSRQNLREVDFPLDAIPKGTFSSIADLTQGEPRVVLETVHAGEPVLAEQVSGSGGKASLSTIINPAKRAVTIRVDDVSGAAGFITPSDRVDVMLTRAQSPQVTQTDVLLQDIKVLAVDQEANERNDKPIVAKAVTLEVTPQQAQTISLARTIGTLSLALRNVRNTDQESTRSISVSDLPGAPRPTGPAAPHNVEIIRGSTSTTYDLKNNTAARQSDQLHKIAETR